MAANNPLDQFKIEQIIPIQIGGYDVSFTNSALWMIAVVIGASALILAGLRRPSLVPGRAQSAVEMIAAQIEGTLVSAAGPEARPYFPIIFTTFLFVLLCNLLGLLPYAYTVTSQIIVTFAIAVVAFVAITIIGIVKQGFGFLRLFAPRGVPLAVMPIVVPIEIISYFVRPFTLSVRLFANMMAGHVLLKLLGGFVVLLGLAGIVPLAFTVAIFALELLVAAIQAFVFTTLLSVYLNDALHGH